MRLLKLRSKFFKHFPKTYYRINFLLRGKLLHIDNPVNINDLIINGIIYKSDDDLIINCTDKIKVRDYVKSKGLENILVPLIKKYDNVEEIDLSVLPEKFVLKANHGCGFYLILDKNKDININTVKRKADSWISNPLDVEFDFEPHYKHIQPQLYCEKYIDDFSPTQFPIDYKVHCFYGEPKFILVVLRYIEGGNRRYKLRTYDLNWKQLPFIKDEYHSNVEVEKPLNLGKMVEYSRTLAGGFDFVRIDFYNNKGKIYFGEMTFTPQGGVLSYYTKEMKQKPVNKL